MAQPRRSSSAFQWSRRKPFLVVQDTRVDRFAIDHQPFAPIPCKMRKLRRAIPHVIPNATAVLCGCPYFPLPVLHSHRAGKLALKYAAIGPIAVHLPERVETNSLLQSEYPDWDMELIHSKTGISTRHIAAPGKCASDLGVRAAEKLFSRYGIEPASIDFLLFCTQTPDYPLPTTACLMQDRLGLSTSVGALDFNLGCSGFVYGVSLAEGLIRMGAARRVLLITAETYSKYISPADRSLRTIFGDGAAATLIEAADEPSLSAFVFGTDGRGADALLVNCGGARQADSAIQPRKRRRWNSPLFMDGPGLVNFTTQEIPKLVAQVLTVGQTDRQHVDLFLLHQASKLMLQRLREALELDAQRLPISLEHCGNTVSATIPILIDELRTSGQIKPGTRSMLVGFGVGYSWAGCLWNETWQAPPPNALGH